MKKIKYTLLGEGFAEEEFIAIYLKKVGVKLDFELQRNTKLKLTNPNKERVLENAKNFCIRSLSDLRDDLFVVGIDLDEADYSLEKFEAAKQKVEQAIGKNYEQFKTQVIIFVPIQAIDYWLYYQYYKLQNTKKPADNSLESKTKNEVKNRIYPEKNERAIRKIARQVSEKADFEELAKQSSSFKDFHKQTQSFLNSLRVR
ncbi:MAG: hypothetical protein U0Y10_12815 [Spirosomataceae bacterium]